MNNAQQNRVDMFNAVAGYMASSSNVWAGKPAVVKAVGALIEQIADIGELTGQQTSDTSGVTADKESVRNDYEDTVFEIAEQLGAFAAETKNLILAGQVGATRADLDKLSDGDLQTYGERVALLTTQNLSSLTDYDVTQADLSALEALKTQFGTVSSAPRVAISARKGHTQSLPGLLNETSALLRGRLDKLMAKFRRTQPQFFAGYQAARVIVDRGHGAKETAPAPSP